MTFAQLKALEVGAEVTLRQSRGRVTQLTKTWFRIVWDDGSVVQTAKGANT